MFVCLCWFEFHKELKLSGNLNRITSQNGDYKNFAFRIIIYPKLLCFQDSNIEEFLFEKTKPKNPILSKWPMKASYMPEGILVNLNIPKHFQIVIFDKEVFYKILENLYGAQKLYFEIMHKRPYMPKCNILHFKFYLQIKTVQKCFFFIKLYSDILFKFF